MAAKKKQSDSGEGHVPAWLAVLVALLIGGGAVYAVLSMDRETKSTTLPKLADEPESPTHHDREQIDQESRDQLRDILRAADNGS